MLRCGKSGELRRSFADFAFALALFWIVALAVTDGHGPAHAIPLPTMDQQAMLEATAPSPASLQSALTSKPAADHRQTETSRRQALVLLSLAFAAIAAINLAFLRHLRRVYASPRRGVWRRG